MRHLRLLAVLTAFALSPALHACVADTVPRCIFTYDSLVEEFEIKVTNLRLSTEQPGLFCTCALGTWDDFLDFTNYVAIVDSGTYDLYPGFAPWTDNANASAAWQSEWPGDGTWQGFVAGVVGAGLFADPVEIIIRGQLPAGYQVTMIDSSFSLTKLGTDAWDDQNQQLAFMHNTSRLIASGQPVQKFVKGKGYFEVVDSTINSQTSSMRQFEASLQIGLQPNPTDHSSRLTFELTEETEVYLDLVTADGKILQTMVDASLPQGQHEATINLSALPNGTYYIRIQAAGNVFARSLVLMR